MSDDIHSCHYACTRPLCEVLRMARELGARVALIHKTADARPEYNERRIIAFDSIEMEDGRVLGEWREVEAHEVVMMHERYTYWMELPV